MGKNDAATAAYASDEKVENTEYTSNTQKDNAETNEDNFEKDSAEAEREDEVESKKRKAEEEADDENSGKAAKVKESDSPATYGTAAATTEGEAETESTTVFVGQLPWSLDEYRLGDIFAEVGPIKSARVQTDRDSRRSRGFGYVEFESPADAKKAVETLQGREVDGRAIRVDFATRRAPRDPTQPREPRGGQRSALQPSSTLFVGGLAWAAGEEDLRDTFGRHGTITSVRVPTDMHSGRPKGFAYIEFGSVDEAQSALSSLNGVDIKGRAVRLDFASSRDGGSGGGRRGGYGGFGGHDRGRGGPRDSYGGSRDSYGGSRDSYGGSRDSYGGSRDSYGGSRDSYGGSRDSYGGSRDGYGGSRDGYRGSRDAYGSGRGNNWGGQGGY